jgi:hypothetical protein
VDEVYRLIRNMKKQMYTFEIEHSSTNISPHARGCNRNRRKHYYIRKDEEKQDHVETKNVREDYGTSYPSRVSQEEKMDEMSILIRNKTKKKSKFEIENRNTNSDPQEGSIRNPDSNQFRRPPNPQLMRRERRNEEQPILPPMKTNNDNNFIEEVVNKSYDEYTK